MLESQVQTQWLLQTFTEVSTSPQSHRSHILTHQEQAWPFQQGGASRAPGDRDLVGTVLTLMCFLLVYSNLFLGFPGASEGKESAFNAGDPGSIPGSGRSLGEGTGNPLWYSCLENPMNIGAWQATVHEVTKSQT